MFNKWISRGDNDRVSAPKLICHSFPKFCVPLFAACFAEGFNYQGWGHGFDFFLFFPPSFAPLGRSSYPGAEEVQDLAAFLLGKISIS
jgi:hypothetical protein